MMKKLKWYRMEDKRISREERALRSIVKHLYRVCKRYRITHSDIYILSTEGSTTLNIRAKKGEDVVVNSYAFIRKGI